VSFLDTLLGRKHPPMIGLDISQSSVKLVELSQTQSGEYILERFASEPFEKGWIADGQIEKFDEVAEAVRKVVTKSGTRTKHVAMAMPQSAVITKKIMLPAGLREEEMEMQVEAEANQYIPFSLDEVSLDFCVVGPSPTSAGDVEVMIAASRKDRVQDRQGLAESAGLKPAILDIESYASRLAVQRLVESLPNEGKDALVALFEIGAENTSLKVLRDNELLYDRSFLASMVFLSKKPRPRSWPAICRKTSRTPSWAPLWTACLKRSAALCSISSPARRTTRFTM